MMFKFHMPTKIIAGENAVAQNPGDLILGTRAMLVTGKSSGKRSGALDDVISVLEENNIPYLVYDKIENNPEIEAMADGGAAAREFGADFLIGIGGGSPLDAAKAIAVYAANEPVESSDFELYDIFDCKFKNKPLPIAAIPTTSGTGSEVTPYSILTLHREKNKRSFSSPEVFCKTAFLDGKYTANLPLQVLRNTAVDAMCHLLEGFTNKKASPASDYIAIEGLFTLGGCIGALVDGSPTASERIELLWASTLGGIVISQTGTTVVHSMGYQLTYYKNIPHGRANGMLLGEYLRRTDTVLPHKTAQYLNALGMESIDELEDVLKRILPVKESFSEPEVTEWTRTTIKAKNVASCPFDVTRAIEGEMYKKSLNLVY